MPTPNSPARPLVVPEPPAREFVEIEDGTGACFTLERGHDCYTAPECCRDCETHAGRRCGDDNSYYGGTYS